MIGPRSIQLHLNFCRHLLRGLRCFQDIADVTSKTAIVPPTPKSGQLKGNNNGNTVPLEKPGAAEKPGSRQVCSELHSSSPF